MRTNSTIISKKRLLSCGCTDFAFSKNKCKLHATIDSTAKREALVKDKSKVRGLADMQDEELSSMQSLILDVDRVFSLYIRLKYADNRGIVTCFVCHRPFHYLKLDNGHYIKRGHNETRFSEDNCYPQCKKCNQIHNDDKKPFKEAIEAHRPGLTEYLEEQSRQVFKWTLDELKQLLINYQQKLKLVETKLK